MLNKHARYYAECGYAVFRALNKRPIGAWKGTEVVSGDQAEAAFTAWTGQLGVILGEHDLVIDVDPRNFADGDKPHARLFEGVDILQYAAKVKTPSGGVHLYLKLPKGFGRVKVKQPDYPGIDFKGLGGYVIGAGSPGYAFTGGLDLYDVKVVPNVVLDRLALAANIEPLASEGPIETDNPQAIEAYIDYLLHANPAIEGQGGDTVTFAVAAAGRDWGLSQAKALELMVEYYDPKCQPPWGPALAQKVANAYAYAKNQAGLRVVEREQVAAMMDTVQLPAEAPTSRSKVGKGGSYKAQLLKDVRMKSGELKSCITNISNFFFHPDHKLNIGLDEFSRRVMFLTTPPWRRDETFPVRGVEWSDLDTAALRLYLSAHGLETSKDLINDAIDAVAQARRYHPVRDYLEGLKWDGVERLGSWLHDYLHVEPTKYHEITGQLMLQQAVERIYEPGCKADYVIVLEGKQDLMKSMLVRVLGEPWNCVIKLNMTKYENTVDTMTGSWFIEIAEAVESFNRLDAQELDGFITMEVDKVRFAYGRRSAKIPRQSVFVATVNPDATREYLMNKTGARRWFPVAVPQRIDIDGVKEAKDQLFAEAVYRYKSGVRAFRIDPRDKAEISELQTQRIVTDPWREPILDYIRSGVWSSDVISAAEIYEHAIRGAMERFNTGAAKRIAYCMQQLGFEIRRTKLGNRYDLTGVESDELL